MKQSLAQIALVVDNYDKAIQYYTHVLKFELIEDTQLSETKRWVLISPPGSTCTKLLLAQASNEEQLSRVGNQTGGRVFLFLHTDDIERDYQNLQTHEVNILRDLVEESWGKVLLFEDLYGNIWDLIQPQ